MRKLRSVLVLLAVFALSLSFAVPAEDVQETAYDESEALPYESTPLFSIMLEESERAAQLVLTSAFLPRVNPTCRRDEILAAQSEQTVRPSAGCVPILNHSLRC